MELSEEQKNEIALLIVEYWISKSNLPLGELRRNMGNVAKAMSVDIDKLMEFIQPIYQKALNKAFKKEDSKPIGYGKQYHLKNE
jgi:hypothetical protein